MQNDVIDELNEDSGHISSFAKLRARQAALWQIIASSVALVLIFFAFNSAAEEFRYKIMWRTEAMCIQFFLLCGAVRFVFMLISGVRYRMATSGRNVRMTDLLHSVRPYNVAWIITGSLALVFAMGMLLYMLAKIELFGYISRELFDINHF